MISFLAYHSAPVGVEQALLTPVYVFGATIMVGDKPFPMRLVTLPATEYGPSAPEPEPQPKRTKRPGRLERRAPLGAPRGGQPVRGRHVMDRAVRRPHRQPGQRSGFVDGLAADGWLINFNWGDANAWESDWRRNDDTWVDAADFVFYTGHASLDGWVLSQPDDGSLTSAEVGTGPGTPGDLWGQQDLEWVVIAACGPLQDDILAPGGGDVLGRWDGAFDGLHSLMGYGAITFDTTEEGKRVVQYARQGRRSSTRGCARARRSSPRRTGPAPRTGRPCGGRDVVSRPGADPRFDHLWGHGACQRTRRRPPVWPACGPRAEPGRTAAAGQGPRRR